MTTTLSTLSNVHDVFPLLAAKATVKLGNISALPAYTCPPRKDDLAKAASGPLDTLVGEILGLQSLIPKIIVGVVVALLIVILIPKLRALLLTAVLWLLGGVIAVYLVLAIADSLVGKGVC